MSYTVKRQREIKCFQFPREGSSTGFVADVSGESVPHGRTREWECSLAKFCTKVWYVIQTALSGSHTSRWSVRSRFNYVARYI